MWWLDRLLAELLAPLAMWVFASGLDDLFLDLCYLYFRLRGRFNPRRGPVCSAAPASHAQAEKRIAVMVPCWREEAVIGRMLARNLRDIQYANYDFWVGVYPNDPATLERVDACRRTSLRIRVALCPRPGPTTKADCLNAIYQSIVRHEEASGSRYGVIVQHDAEDVIHPEALTLLGRHVARAGMIQIPVFPWPHSPIEFTQGTYADEFAESHAKDLLVRSRLGGFVPSAGVGTAFRRETLETLARQNGGAPFDSSSLTEDYYAGLQIHRLSLGALFLREPAKRVLGSPGSQPHAAAAPRAARRWIATRGYFPDTLATAIRQKSRWVTGITLQSWQRCGWRAGPRQIYWLWRDRKGLVVHPTSLLANALCAYGAVRWAWLSAQGQSWTALASLESNTTLAALLAANFALLLWRQAVRMYFVTSLYGLGLGLTVPLRAPWGNLINVCATARAVSQFAAARFGDFRLEWDKTAHTFPGQAHAFSSSHGGNPAGRPTHPETVAALARNAFP
jgi:adsorption protein B